MPDKLQKSTVLYVFKPEQAYTCLCCLFVDEKTSKCKVYGASESISVDTGGCNYFCHADAPQMAKIPMLGLLTKDETGYAENKNGFTCARCDEFILDGDCEEVDKESQGDTPGIIDPHACCNRWEASPVRAKLNDEKLAKLIAEKSSSDQFAEYEAKKTKERK